MLVELQLLAQDRLRLGGMRLDELLGAFDGAQQPHHRVLALAQTRSAADQVVALDVAAAERQAQADGVGAVQRGVAERLPYGDGVDAARLQRRHRLLGLQRHHRDVVGVDAHVEQVRLQQVLRGGAGDHAHLAAVELLAARDAARPARDQLQVVAGMHHRRQDRHVGMGEGLQHHGHLRRRGQVGLVVEHLAQAARAADAVGDHHLELFVGEEAALLRHVQRQRHRARATPRCAACSAAPADAGRSQASTATARAAAAERGAAGRSGSGPERESGHVFRVFGSAAAGVWHERTHNCADRHPRASRIRGRGDSAKRRGKGLHVGVVTPGRRPGSLVLGRMGHVQRHRRGRRGTRSRSS